MQLFVLALILGLFLHDAQSDHEALLAAAPSLLQALLLVLIPKVLVAGYYRFRAGQALGRLGQSDGQTAANRLDRLGAAYRYVTLVLYSLDLFYSQALWSIRRAMGDWVILDELLVMLPTLLLVVWSWWAYYPIERRVREAAIIRRLDLGLPVYPIWSRSQYLVAQIRHQLLLMLVPLLLLLAWTETVYFYIPPQSDWLAGYFQTVLLMGGAGVVFLFAPVMIRYIWDTTPLPEGELRQRLLAMCRAHHVGVRELLLWRTYGGMINAAVMGLLAPLRYILLTDALVEMAPQEQIEAVMAHELAHVRRHHLFWLLVCAAGSLAVLEWLGAMVGWYLAATLGEPQQWPVLHHLPWIGDKLADADLWSILGSVLAAVLWAIVFGWVSRRFERQADAFAVQHLSRQFAAEAGLTQTQRVHPAAVAVMTASLQSVADLNHIPVARRSWRHGSIAWRQAYLQTLIGQPLDALAIDRLIRRLKIAAGVIVALLIVASIVQASL